MIKIESCRGTDKKLELIEQYKIYPISFVKLLKGQKKTGCCGKLTDKYYAFELVDRKNERNRGGFLVGYHCGREFLDLLNIDHRKFTLFNPLRNLSSKDDEAGENKKDQELQEEKEKDDKDSRKIVIDPLNKEVYDAIHIVITAWSGAPYGDYARIINYIKNNPERRVSDRVIQKVNFLISRDSKNRSLIQIVSELRKDYSEFKEFNFDELNRAVERLIEKGEEKINYIY